MGLTTGLASRFTLLLGCSGRLGEKKSTRAFFRVLIMIHTKESRRKTSCLTRLNTCTLMPSLSHSHHLLHTITTSFTLTPPVSHHLLHTHTTFFTFTPPSHSHHLLHTHTTFGISSKYTTSLRVTSCVASLTRDSTDSLTCSTAKSQLRQTPQRLGGPCKGWPTIGRKARNTTTATKVRRTMYTRHPMQVTGIKGR